MAQFAEFFADGAGVGFSPAALEIGDDAFKGWRLTVLRPSH